MPLTSMQATALQNSISVTSAETLPDGVGVVMVDCIDYAALRKLPAGISYQGKTYGRTGWNSDRHVAYYRTDKEVATAA